MGEVARLTLLMKKWLAKWLRINGCSSSFRYNSPKVTIPERISSSLCGLFIRRTAKATWASMLSGSSSMQRSNAILKRGLWCLSEESPLGFSRLSQFDQTIADTQTNKGRTVGAGVETLLKELQTCSVVFSHIGYAGFAHTCRNPQALVEVVLRNKKRSPWFERTKSLRLPDS